MPSINLSYINIALNLFGLIVMLIVFWACFSEWMTKKTTSKSFLCLLVFVIIALAADVIAWTSEGHLELYGITLISNTVASCSAQLAMICFMEYLCQNLYENSKAAACTLNIFRLFCVMSLAYSVGNAFFGYSFFVNSTGHYVHSDDVTMVFFYLSFSICSFVVLILMALFANSSTKSNRLDFIVYTIFPLAGIVIDYTYHGISLTYVSMVVSVLVIYTHIYRQRQKMIDAQRNALMLSQINPHFTYNTLSTIAAMCDTSPKLAKSLTIDFSRYLRHNMDVMMNEQVIPFEKELEHVECYLKIEQARFREDLNVIYAVQCRDFLLPPLTIQPIVENAVKHGITKRAGGGTVKISTYSTEKSYVVEIIDDGVGFDTEKAVLTQQRHIGLENVRDRVHRVCKGSVSIKSTIDVGTRVTIEIPRRKGK